MRLERCAGQLGTLAQRVRMNGPLASFAVGSAKPLGEAFLVLICYTCHLVPIATIGLQVAATMHHVY